MAVEWTGNKNCQHAETVEKSVIVRSWFFGKKFRKTWRQCLMPGCGHRLDIRKESI
jgi:hypothetical protein